MMQPRFASPRGTQSSWDSSPGTAGSGVGSLGVAGSFSVLYGRGRGFGMPSLSPYQYGAVLSPGASPPPHLTLDDGGPVINPTPRGGSEEEPSPASVPSGAALLPLYRRGQLATMTSVGVWWVFMGPVILSLFHADPWGVALAKICFDVFLLLLSPLATSVAERVPLRSILKVALTTRVLVYAVLVPLLWLIVESGVVLKRDEYFSAFRASFFPLMAVDGMAVAFTNLTDIDGGGLSLLAAQYSIHEMSVEVKQRMMAYYERAYWVATVLVAPCLALICYYITFLWERHFVSTLLFVLGGTFLTSYIVAMHAYTQMPELVIDEDDPELGRALPNRREVNELLLLIGDGLKLCWKNRALRFRILFLSLSASFADATVVLVIPKYALEGLLGRHNTISANILLAICMISCGKLGEVFGTFFMRRFFSLNNASVVRFRALLVFPPIAGLVVLLLPISTYVADSVPELAHTMAFVGVFFFFLFVTIAKVGLSGLFPYLVGQQELIGPIFAFMSLWGILTDMVVIASVAAVLHSIDDIATALWVTSSLILACFTLEALLSGPFILDELPNGGGTPLLRGLKAGSDTVSDVSTFGGEKQQSSING